MNDITDITIPSRSVVDGQSIRTIVVSTGFPGRPGPGGDEGEPGEPGASIVVRGQWISGTSYQPLDAVRDRSSLVDHVYSLWVQKSAAAASPSTVQPYLDPGRWQEVGPYEWGNYLGGMWEVAQTAHGFTKIGQPVAFSPVAGKYVLASSSDENLLGVAVVREVTSPDLVVLQSTGGISELDDTIIDPPGTTWSPGAVYFVATSPGRVSEKIPTSPMDFANPILQATAGTDGIVLPWTPVRSGEYNNPFNIVGFNKFYYTATAGQDVISGVDERGTSLLYLAGDSTDVFIDGRTLHYDEFEAVDGSTITLTTPLTEGQKVEVWTPANPTDLVVPSTVAKLDALSFDGVTASFPLFTSGAQVNVQNPNSLLIFVDATGQEPLLDYSTTNDPSTGQTSLIFTVAPEAGARFWGVVYMPAESGGWISGDGYEINTATGRQTCWGRVEVRGNTDPVTVTFPAEFNEPPIMTLTARAGTGVDATISLEVSGSGETFTAQTLTGGVISDVVFEWTASGPVKVPDQPFIILTPVSIEVLP